jgi:ribosome-associated protein
MIPNTLKPILSAINKKSGQNVTIIDVKNLTSFTDFIIIAEGSIGRHIHAIADAIHEEVKKNQPLQYIRVEGKSNEDWIVLDCSHAIIHLFVPHMRQKYDLETIWNNGKIIRLEQEGV